MALSGTVNSSGYEGRYVKLTWSATQSIANNTSTISWSLTGAGTGQAGWYMAGGFYVKIAGQVVCNWSTDTRIKLYNGTGVASGSLTVSHSNDGTKSFSVEIQAGIYTYARNCSGSGNFTLNTIPRASSFGTITGSTIGSQMTVNLNRASSSFTHQFWYKLGNSQWYDLGKGFGASVKFTPTMDLCSQLPNATSGTLNLCIRTFNGNTAIGNDVYKDVKVNVPSSVIPTISSASVSVDNSANDVVKSWGLYVAGYSKVKVVASASGIYKSTISSFTISGGYSVSLNGSSLNYTGGILTSSGSKTFDVVAKDSRGRSSAKKTAGTITVYAYSNPSITLFDVARSEVSAKNVVVRANWNFASVNGKNSASATLYYKKSISSGWSTYGAISKNTSVTLSTEFDEASSYNFRIIVTDALGNKAQEENFISTLSVLLDFRAGGKGLGIGKIAETDSMEVAMEAKFMETVYIYDSDGTVRTLADYIKHIVASG